MRELGIVFLLMSSVAPALAQGGCSQGAAQHAAAQVRLRQTELEKVQLGEDDTAPEIPLSAQRLMPGLKDALAAAVDADMRCLPAGASAPTIQRSLENLLTPLGPDRPLKSTPDAGVYGVNLHSQVSASPSAPQMRAIQLSYGIACGDDTMLLLYEQQPDGWRQVLRWQSKKQEFLSDAFGDFFSYTFLPGKDASTWRVVVAHGTPLCTSRWSEYKLDVLTAGAKADTPHIVWHHDEGYLRDSPVNLTARLDGFEMRAQVGAIDADRMERKGIFRYRVDGDNVERVQPIAVDGRGFVDAWLGAPWSSAKNWSAPAGLASFERAHNAFTKAHDAGSATYSYGPVRACSAKGRFEVEMIADPGGPQFYAIEQGQNGYTMVNFGTTQDKRCNGPDLTKKR